MSDDAQTLPPGQPAGDSSVTMLAKGARLQEFEVTGVVGEGGFGIVYEAMDTLLNRRVAIKEYMPSQLAARVSQRTVKIRSQEFAETFSAGLKSFINEARMLAQFKHPALVEVFRFWEENGTAYMAMPLYEGPTLKHFLSSHPEMSNERWLRGFLAPVLDALEHMHGMQVYHRDIAPDNLLILKNGAPLLLDLGAARRVIGDMTHALTVILKPGYAPIEQYADDPAVKQGPWTDIYALAAVVYFAIARRAPPPAVSRMIKDPFKPLSELAPAGFSADFLAAVDRGLLVRPELRPQTIEEFRSLLGVQSFTMNMAPSSLTSAAQAADAALVSNTAAKAAAAQTALRNSAGTPTPPRQSSLPLVHEDPEKTLPPPMSLPPGTTSARTALPEPAPIPAAQAPGAPAAAPPPAAPPPATPAPATPPPAAAPAAAAAAVTAALHNPTSAKGPVTPAPAQGAKASSPTRASTTPSPAGSPVAAKQSRSPLPIIIGVVSLLIGGAGAAWYLGRPDRVVADPPPVASAPVQAPAAAPVPAPAPAPEPAQASVPASASASAPSPAPASTPAPAPASAPSPAPPSASASAPSPAPASAPAPAPAQSPPAPTPAAPAPPPATPPRPAAEAPAPAPVSAPAASATAPAAVAAAPAELRGTLRLSVRPWGEIFVNGASRGISPPVKRLTLPEGSYRIEVRNPAGPSLTRQIDIKNNQSVTIEHQF